MSVGQTTAPTSRRKGRGAGQVLFPRDAVLFPLVEDEVRFPREDPLLLPVFFCVVAIQLSPFQAAAGTRVQPIRLSTRNTRPAAQQ